MLMVRVRHGGQAQAADQGRSSSRTTRSARSSGSRWSSWATPSTASSCSRSTSSSSPRPAAASGSGARSPRRSGRRSRRRSRSTKPAIVEAVVDPFEPPHARPGDAQAGAALRRVAGPGRAEPRARSPRTIFRDKVDGVLLMSHRAGRHRCRAMRKLASANRAVPDRAGRRLGLHACRPTPPSRTGPTSGTHTTLVLVEATGGGQTGLGYTYADTATATLVRDLLAEVVRGRDAMARARRLVGDGRGDPQPRPARGRLDGDLGRRRGALGPEGPAARPARWSRSSGAVRDAVAGLRQRRVHVVFDRAAAGPARRLGRRGHPAGQDEDRPRSRPTTSAGSGPPARRSAPTPSCSSTPTAPTAASRPWRWPSGSPSWA